MKPTREEYELMQESSQHFDESYKHFCDRIQRQDAQAAANLSQCKYALASIAAIMKNGKPGILWFCTDNTGKFAMFPNKKNASEFHKSTIDYVKNGTYKKWEYIPPQRDKVTAKGKRRKHA